MSWSWTLYRYIGKQYLLGVGVIFGIFLLLAFSISLVDLLGRTAGKGVSTTTLIGMGFLHLPNLGQKLLPFAVLLGGVFTFVRLSRSQELVATRAAGVSAWDFLTPPLVVAVILGIGAVTVGTPISSKFLSRFAALEAKYVHGQASQLAVSTNGLWLRQGDAQHQSVIHALRVSDQGARLDDVIIFLYGAADQLEGRIDARNAQLRDGSWLLNDAWVSGKDGKPVPHAQYELPTTLTPARIQESFASPDTLSFWDLPGFIHTAQAAGFAATRYQLHLYSLFAMPALFAAMVFMSASFSLRLARYGGVIRIILYSALAGFGVYFFSDLTQALGQSGVLPLGLAATVPAAATILIGMTLVFHREDG